MGALVVVFAWIGINALISYFEDKKQPKKMETKEKKVIKSEYKNYNFDLFNDYSDLQSSPLKRSA